MSISLMSLAWKTNLPVSQKMALLAMCDWANDEGGSLHPSIARIAERISCSERQAKRIIHDLIELGFLAVVGNENGGAPGQSRRYQLNVKRLETGVMGVTGDKLSRVTPKAETGDIRDTRRVTSATKTGDMGVTLTTIEPSIEPSGNHQSACAKPDDVDAQVWADFLALRKQKRANLTSTALTGIRNAAEKAGYSLQSALELCCERGWQSLRADWIADKPVVNKVDALRERNRQNLRKWREQSEGASYASV